MGIARIAGDDLPVRHGIASAGDDRHALAVGRMARDRRVHRAAVLPKRPRDDALVRPAERVVGKLRSERLMRRVVLGGNDQTARVAVDAVHDARAQRAADAGKACAAVVEQRVDERAVRMPRRGVHDQSRRLIDNDHVLVLVYDVKRDILRHGVDRLRFGERQLHRFAAGEPEAFHRRSSVHQYAARFNELRRRRARQLLRAVCEKGVQPFALRLFSCLEQDRLHPFSPSSLRRSPCNI